MPSVLPVAVLLGGRRCLVVGAGEVAARKVRDLLVAGAAVHVVAPELDDSIAALAASAQLTTRVGRYEASDLEGAWLVVVATRDRDVNQRVYDDAERRGLWVNSADDPARCSFYFTAVVHRDPVVVSISTSGVAPGVASYVRRRLDELLDAALGEVAALVGEVRAEVHSRGGSTEALQWDRVIDDDLVALVSSGDVDRARTRLRSASHVDRARR